MVVIQSPPSPLRVSFRPLRVGSHASSVGAGGLVSVSAPVVSDSGLAPGHLSKRWGDFPHSQGCRPRESGSLYPVSLRLRL